MGIIKVIIAFAIIGSLESIIIKDKKDNEEEVRSDKRCFEIAMSILMAAWIMRNGW